MSAKSWSLDDQNGKSRHRADTERAKRETIGARFADIQQPTSFT